MGAFREAKLDFDEIVFPLTTRDLVLRTQKVLQNGLKKKIVHVTRHMSLARNWKTTAYLYENTIFAYDYIKLPSGKLAMSKVYEQAK